MKRSWLVVGIILLFVGVTIAPSINQIVVTASQENDFVEVTSQACGIQGYGDTTVKLTREQYQNLEQYLAEFRARLNQTTTREEAVPIFKDAVMELDRYGLLPKGMGVERAQKFVIKNYQNKNINKIQEKLTYNRPHLGNNINNTYCLIAGKADYCYFVGPLYTILSQPGLFRQLFILLSGGFSALFYKFWFFISNAIFWYIPINPFGTIYFGRFSYLELGGHRWFPSTGEIFSIDSFGSMTINGEFYGGLGSLFMDNLFSAPGGEYYFIGAIGFSGIQFYSKSTHFKYFIGSCIELNISTEKPPV